MLALTGCSLPPSGPILRLEPDKNKPLPTPGPVKPTRDNPPPRTDGNFDEWVGVAPLARDLSGDALGGFDVTRLYATSRGSTLYLRFDVGKELNLQAGAAADRTLVVEITLPGDRKLLIDIRGRRIRVEGQDELSWENIALRAAPTHAASEFEMQINLLRFKVGQGSQIEIDFSGSDWLDQPARFTLADPRPKLTPIALDRETGVFRLANLNTLFDGLLEGERGQAIGRLFRAVKADVYTLQEEWNASAEAIARAFDAIDPHGDAARWHAHKVNDCVIVSRSELLAVPTFNERYAAAIVKFNNVTPLLVVSIHPKCCGYLGSKEDAERDRQFNDIARTIARLRSGGFGPELATYRDVPVVLAGDWNLVGGAAPLTILTGNGKPGLRRITLRHTHKGDLYTWRKTGSSFWPGLLDLIVYSPDTLSSRKGFVLDSAALPSTTRTGLGLQLADSAASDHLLLVADWALKSAD